MTMSRAHWVFIDANILLFVLGSFFPEHELAKAALQQAQLHERQLCISPQIFRECLVVATGKLQARLKQPVALTANTLDELVQGFAMAGDNQDVLLRLRDLAGQFGVRGKRLHDLNIVATMLTHQIPVLLTNNPSDFKDFDGLIDIIPLSAAGEALR